MRNHNFFLISNEFQLKAYTCSLNSEFSYIDCNLDFDQIISFDYPNMPVYAAYFFKAMCSKYNTKDNGYEVNLFLKEIAEVFIVEVKEMLDKDKMVNGFVSFKYSKFPQAFNICAEFKNLIVSEYVSYVELDNTCDAHLRIRILFYFQKIFTGSEDINFSEIIFNIISKNKESFLLNKWASSEDILEVIDIEYQDFLDIKSLSK